MKTWASPRKREAGQAPKEQKVVSGSRSTDAHTQNKVKMLMERHHLKRMTEALSPGGAAAHSSPPTLGRALPLRHQGCCWSQAFLALLLCLQHVPQLP